MTIVGLTGSVGMGKSTVSRMLRQMAIPVFDADAVVHALMTRDHTVRAALAAAFPECVDMSRVDGVNRGALGAVIFGDVEKKTSVGIYPASSGGAGASCLAAKLRAMSRGGV